MCINKKNIELAKSGVTKLSLGVSGPINDGVELEASVGVAMLTHKGYEKNDRNVKVASADTTNTKDFV